MTKKIFYCWQSTTPSAANRSLIESALKQAINGLNAEIEDAARPDDDWTGIELDSDTRGISGSPDIAATILTKIDQADAVVADLTFVGRDENGKPIPNPNVLIEYGYAVKSRGYECVVAVFNTNFGRVEDLPFDVRGKRVITFKNDPQSGDRAQARAELAGRLTNDVRTILKMKSEQDRRDEQMLFQPAQGHGPFGARFVEPGVPFLSALTHEFHLREGPCLSLRLWPKHEVEPIRLGSMDHAQLAEMFAPYGRTGAGTWGRNGDGFAIAWYDADFTVHSATQLFRSGEIWSVGDLFLQADGKHGGTIGLFGLRDHLFSATGRFLRGAKDLLDLTPPLILDIAISDVLDFVPGEGNENRWQHRLHVPKVSKQIEIYSLETINAEQAAKPFLEELYDLMGLEYNWFD